MGPLAVSRSKSLLTAGRHVDVGGRRTCMGRFDRARHILGRWAAVAAQHDIVAVSYDGYARHRSRVDDQRGRRLFSPQPKAPSS